MTRINLGKAVSLEALEACRHLAYLVAHDFGNMRTAVDGNAELIVRGHGDDASLMRRTQNILVATGQMARLSHGLEQFLGYPSRDNPTATIAAADFGGIAPEVAPNLPPVALSVARLQRVVTALIDNAKDATLNHLGAIRATVAMMTVDEAEMAWLLRSPKMRPGQCLVLTVEDEGEGMAAETVRHCFEPAFSTRLRRQGMGLSEVYGIVCNACNGGISLWTQENVGTRIAAHIPVTEQRDF